MERNPHYWDNAKTVINTVTWLPTSSEVTYVNRYRSGELDMTYNQLPIELFQKLKKEIPNELHVDPYLCTYYYEINNQKAPFTDVRVRTALKLGLDRDIIANKVKGTGRSAGLRLHAALHRWREAERAGMVYLVAGKTQRRSEKTAGRSRL
ncbi:oligopeptide ABC transporter substrate-binding protein OppA [Klebsiella pneumoniae subsp. rhinoscleromatis]|nr:oligopeptide ABC transporter substrate-binding protein OppA [Klebsiella pneumoniae subsp. rhinoscleromatis]